MPSNDPVQPSIEQDQILTVEISRPDKRNTISPEITDALWQAVLALGTATTCGVVIAATGEYFTAGIDLSLLFGARPGDPATRHLHPGWSLRRTYRSHHLLYDELEAVEKPVVVAVQGHCFGAGVEMAASADFRFCTPRATFKLPEVEIGVVPGSGGVSRLTRIIGPAEVKWMAMAAMPVTVDEAHAMGLVHRVFPEPTFRDEVHAFCRHLVGLPAEPWASPSCWPTWPSTPTAPRNATWTASPTRRCSAATRTDGSPPGSVRRGAGRARSGTGS